ncbi:hypothetical protein [Amycolatopsis nalaikhensis]|uniref:Secreted protein n=1 Tax=Amycolatopsis nalaikhensis TaxID=715472 RepID=A0ABY8XP90_9PSEU|nr:hypothetical protein [Amycolatopsis sp. 2-2]WIV57437.1 hypothetical protein QP939_01720 [Amycolatopsis sp. 2-2]
MNNASAGPWWFTAVVAGITAVTALITGLTTAWITNHYASRRSNADLHNTRSQFEKQLNTQREQFAEQMSAQREIEQRKLVHEARQKAYLELVECSYVMFKLTRTIELSGARGMPSEDWEKIERFQSVTLACRALGSERVQNLADRLMNRIEHFGEAVGEARLAGDRQPFDVLDAYEPVRALYAEVAKAVRADLGVLD